MELADVDARIVTGVSLCLIGFIVLAFTFKVWFTHPLNRAFLLGPYLTPEGLKVVLRGWPTLFLLGALAIAAGVSRLAYWLQARDYAPDELAATLGLIEASLSLWAAGTLSVFALRTWLGWRRQKR
jgi:hypothetical protein